MSVLWSVFWRMARSMTRPVERRYARRGDLLWRETFDRVLVVVPGTDEVLAISETGIPIWHQLAEPLSLVEIASRIAPSYDIAPASILEGIGPLIEELVERRLVEER